MNKLIRISLLSIFLFVSSFQLASAHMTESDENISVLIHINPDDDPVARFKDSSLYFQVNDSTNTFKGESCDCTFSVWENNQPLYTGKLFEKSDSDPTATIVPYIFPERGIYQVIMSGNPTEANKFQPFSVTFNVRVEREDLTQPKPTAPELALPFKILLSFVTVAIILLFIVLIFTKQKK